MESLRRMIQQITERYGLLEPSQKVAIALCVVVIAGCLYSLARWSTKPTLVPIMARDFTFDQMDDAEEALTTEGIPFERSGRRLLVHEKDKYNAVRVLNRANALPEDFEFGFAKLMEEDATFKPSQVVEHQQKVALGYELAKVIASSPSVESALVLIQQQSKRSIGQQRARPSASVKLTMKSGRPVTETVIEGCARLVATAVPGLSPHDVTVFDTRTLKAHSPKNPDELLETGLLEARKQNEQHLLAKVLAQLAYIPGILANVSVELDGSKSRIESISYSEAEVKSEETSMTKNGSASTPGETGVNPNTGVALNASSGATESESEESRTENFEPKVTERKVEDIAPFAPKRATAAINIPRSYIMSVVTARNPDKDDLRDTDTAFVDVRDEVFTSVRGQVKSVLHAKANVDVEVDMYYDVEGAGGVAGVGGVLGMAGADMTAAATLSTTQMLTGYAPQIGLAALALVSLAMMMMMVRKTTHLTRSAVSSMQDEQESDEFAVAADGALLVSGGPVGQAEISEGFLVGKEVDEKVLHNKELDEQVSRLVDDDPEGVADLLRRWVEQPD